MTIVFTETWTGTNGAAWPAQWTASSATNTIQSNQGRMICPTFGSSVSAYAPLSPTLADCEALLSFIPDASTLTVTTTLSVALRADGAGTASAKNPPTTGVSLYLVSDGTSSSQRTVSGTTTFTNSGTAGSAWTAGTVYNARIHIVGTHIQMRWWDSSGSEPGTWALDSTNAAYPTSAGSLRLSFTGSGSSTHNIFVDDLTIDDLSSAASNPPPIRTINRVPLVRAANF